MANETTEEDGERSLKFIKKRNWKTERRKAKRKNGNAEKMEKPNVLWPHFVLFISFRCGEAT